jgi:hypothetical protein
VDFSKPTTRMFVKATDQQSSTTSRISFKLAGVVNVDLVQERT